MHKGTKTESLNCEYKKNCNAKCNIGLLVHRHFNRLVYTRRNWPNLQIIWTKDFLVIFDRLGSCVTQIKNWRLKTGGKPLFGSICRTRDHFLFPQYPLQTVSITKFPYHRIYSQGCKKYILHLSSIWHAVSQLIGYLMMEPKVQHVFISFLEVYSWIFRDNIPYTVFAKCRFSMNWVIWVRILSLIFI